MSLEEVIRNKHAGDNEQIEFIFSEDKRIVVTAPAGCGKTTAMVSKIVREICSGNISSNKKVLAMTFSVNAAIRIKDSVKQLLPSIVDNTKPFLNKVDIANYHNFAMRLLHKYGYVLNNNFINLSEFRIIDDDTVLKQSMLTSTDEFEFEKLGNAVKNVNHEELVECIDTYWNIMDEKFISRNIITYNGILVSAIKLLTCDNVSNFYRNYYQLIIIDEFQDTNILGYLLIDKLVGNNKIIFLGDDIQKIYGFLGAMDDAFGIVEENYSAKSIAFKHNYRFQYNERMKNMNLLIRDYAENYKPSALNADILLKKMNSDEQEVEFIVDGINKIISANNNVAILVRAGWQGNVIVSKLEECGIPFFNALYLETDSEYLKFYNIAIEEFHSNVSGKAVQSALRKCLKAIKERENEIYSDASKKYIFDSLFKLLEKLFEISRTWDGTSKERYLNIDFSLGNKGLKHMMEYLDEKVIMTTIHSAKGLEWDYVIVPQMNASIFPSWSHVCKYCKDVHGCNSGFDYCVSNFSATMERKFKEELSTFYVALTRAKKDVFVTVNTGKNRNGYNKQTNCFLNLPGLVQQDFSWDDMF